MGRRLLVVALVIFIVLDLGLFFYFFFKNPFSLKQDFKLKKEVPPQLYPVQKGSIQMLPGNPVDLTMTRFFLKGYIEKTPFLDEKDQKYKVDVLFPRKNKGSVISKVVLGNKDRLLGVSLAKKGVIENQRWGLQTVSQLLPSLRKNNPIMLQIIYQKSLQNIYDNEKCDLYCQKDLDTFKDDAFSLFENNTMLIRGIKEEVNIESGFEVGPVSQMVIYQSN